MAQVFIEEMECDKKKKKVKANVPLHFSHIEHSTSNFNPTHPKAENV